jgi:hypothetical protein
MGFAVIHRIKAIILGVTQKARWDGVTLVAGIVVDVMIHACASTLQNCQDRNAIDISTD